MPPSEVISMLFDFHEFLLRISGSLEVATIVAATAVVYLGIVRHALLGWAEGLPLGRGKL